MAIRIRNSQNISHIKTLVSQFLALFNDYVLAFEEMNLVIIAKFLLVLLFS